MKPDGKRSAPWITRQMIVLFAILGSMPLWAESVGLYQYLGVEIAIWMIFALGFNLLLGYTGLPSFGHGAFFGLGAYAFGLVQHNLAVSLWLGLLGAIALAALGGALVACFLSHRRGIYFALMSIAFGQVFQIVFKCGGFPGGVQLGPAPALLVETPSLLHHHLARSQHLATGGDLVDV